MVLDLEMVANATWPVVIQRLAYMYTHRKLYNLNEKDYSLLVMIMGRRRCNMIINLKYANFRLKVGLYGLG